MWGSPLKQPKATVAAEKAEAALFKKPKPKISRGAAKRILDGPVDPHIQFRLIDAVDNLVRTEGLPPQLVSDDFICLLTQFCGAPRAETLLRQIRTQFGTATAMPTPTEDDATLGYLLRAVAADPLANPLLLLEDG